MHPFTPYIRGYADGDLERLASRLEIEAQNELHLFLAYVYRLGNGSKSHTLASLVNRIRT